MSLIRHTFDFAELSPDLFKAMAPDEQESFNAFVERHKPLETELFVDAAVLLPLRNSELVDIFTSPLYSFNYKQAIAFRYGGAAHESDYWGFENFEQRFLNVLWTYGSITEKELTYAARNPNLEVGILAWATSTNKLTSDGLLLLQKLWSNEILTDKFLCQLWDYSDYASHGVFGGMKTKEAFGTAKTREYAVNKMRQRLELDEGVPDSWVVRVMKTIT